MFADLLPSHNAFVAGAIFVAAYLLTLAIGRVLKRRGGVRFAGAQAGHSARLGLGAEPGHGDAQVTRHRA